MKVNMVQQLGIAGMVGGGLMLWLRLSEFVFPKWDVGGGTITFKLPDSWVDPAFIVGGLLVLIVGTAYQVFRGREDSDDEEKLEKDVRE
jgi:hypothetical protein